MDTGSYMQNQMDNLIESGQKEFELAFNARLEYELNCLKNKDKPKRGEFMSDFAAKYNTSVEYMKKVEREVDKYMKDHGYL